MGSIFRLLKKYTRTIKKTPRVFWFIVSTLCIVLTVMFLTTSYSGVLWRCCKIDTTPLIVFNSNAELQYEIGSYYFGGGEYDLSKAENKFRQAIQTSERQGDNIQGLHYQLARLYFIQGNFFEARKHIDLELSLFPDYKRSYYVRGLINGYAGKLEDAEKDFKAFLAWKPESWAGHNDLVWIYFTKGDYKNAEKYAREGLAYTPNNPWLNNALGVALLNLKQYDEAATHLRLALDGFGHMTPTDWGVAYPGNNPDLYTKGYNSTKEIIEKNLQLAEAKSRQSTPVMYPGVHSNQLY